MNEKIKTLIEKRITELEETKQKERDKHLISLGLTDESKTERQYIGYYKESAKYDKDKKMHYIESAGALDVSDAEYEEICKYFSSTPEKKVKVHYGGSGVKTLNGFGTFFFVIASIAMLVVVIGFIMYLANDIDSKWEAENAMIGLSLASSLFPIAIGSFAGGAICKGLSGIAKTALYKRIFLEEQYRFVE